MGVFAKVILAIAILVVNGALLFFILRFLLWLAFPSMKDGAGAAPIPARPSAPAAGSAALAALGADLATAPLEPPASASPPIPGAMPVFVPSTPRPRAYPHRLLIGLPVILALFAGGVWLGSVVGGSGAASAATTIRLKGKVVTVNSTMTEVKVPAIRTVVKGDVITVPEKTVPLPSHTLTRFVRVTRTRVIKLPGTTIVRTTVLTIPTTITATGTVTVVSTTTETVTTTGSTGTTTTT